MTTCSTFDYLVPVPNQLVESMQKTRADLLASLALEYPLPNSSVLAFDWSYAWTILILITSELAELLLYMLGYL